MVRRTIGGFVYNLSYDAENHMTNVSGQETNNFLYDGDGNRVKGASDYVNLAAGIVPTSTATLNYPGVITNGDTWATGSYGPDQDFSYTTQGGLQFAQIDLGAAYMVDKIILWHYGTDGRTYHQTKTQVSTDGQNWTTVYDSAVSGEYQETAAGKTISFTSRSVRYVRDYLNGSTQNAGNHWVEIEVWGRASTTYIGNYYEQTGGTARTYYYAGGQRIAMRLRGTLYFLLGDHLGSTAVMASASGVLLTGQRYMPWGTSRSAYQDGDTPTTYRFTSQRSEEVRLGLYFYGSRFYDPWLGRFTSPDSDVPESQGPQAWDRYAYLRHEVA